MTTTRDTILCMEGWKAAGKGILNIRSTILHITENVHVNGDIRTTLISRKTYCKTSSKVRQTKLTPFQFL